MSHFLSVYKLYFEKHLLPSVVLCLYAWSCDMFPVENKTYLQCG